MMLAALIAALVLSAASITLAAYATHQALSWASRGAAAEVGVALAQGRERLATLEEQRARDNAREAARLAQAEQARGDYLEAELSHAESEPFVGTGDPARDARERLRRAVGAVTAAVRPPRSGDSAGEIAVPDATPAAPVSAPPRTPR